eukprot:TRINITY_DN1380_c0_g1_i1.p1 TRINITY_DN1380_c0_g1~~TRINITY_DN1380_c0_g1_i1.p1  ORF type:complete len:423 (+),score=100.30 TRINITY_DN1380_c0_g1_i1:38-1270(+)
MEQPTQSKAELSAEELVDNENRSSLAKLLSQAIGVDITRITIPVSYNEPTSFIMRVAEATLHNYLLKIADQVYEQDKDLALLYVSMFAMSSFAVCAQRVSKPFNPLLGETFEYVDEEHGVKFFIEQVSHHPPIAAAVLDSEHFKMEVFHEVKTKFTGNAVDAEPLSRARVTLKTSGAQYTYGGIHSTCHCILVGRMWLDVHGDIKIEEIGTTRVCNLTATKCGWFSRGWHEVSGQAQDTDGNVTFQIEGKWNEVINATRKIAGPKLVRSGSPKTFPAGVIPLDKTFNDIPDFEVGVPTPVWENITIVCEEEPYCTWNMTDFARKLCFFDDKYRAILPPTDTRLRKDRMALEEKDYATAAVEKLALEEEQRRQKRIREVKGEEWEIKHFVVCIGCGMEREREIRQRMDSKK